MGLWRYGAVFAASLDLTSIMADEGRNNPLGLFVTRQIER
jgi:hypothetical protein